MPYNAGTAYLQVTPSFRDIDKNIVAELRKVAREFGKEIEKSLPQAMTDAFEKASKDASKSAGKAAENIASNHAEAVRRINDKAADETVRKTRETAKKQGDIYSGLEILRRKRAELALREYDRFKAQELRAEERAEQERVKMLDRSAQQRAKVANAFADAREKAQAKVAADALRREEALAEAIEKAHDNAFREDLRRQKALLEEEEKASEKRLALARKEMQEYDKALAKKRAEARRIADEAFGKSTAGKATSGIGSAVQAIQEIPVKLNDDSIEGEMQRIRARLAAFKDVKIGVDIDVEDFVNEARAQFDRLRDISRDVSVDIDVRTDAAAAASEIGAVLVMLNRLDGKEADVKVDVDSDTARGRLLAMAQTIDVNLSRLGQMIAIGAALGSAIVPAAAVATAAIAAIGAAALAASIGLGVMALGFSGIGEAVKALNQQQDDAAKIAKSQVAAENAVANAVQGVAAARRSLANTIANNRDAAIRAAQSIQDAERDLAKARQRAARDAEQSERRLAAARERAAEDAANAARRVGDAQRALQRDEENAKRAREELTEAYRDAQRAFEELSSQIKHNALDQQTAMLDIAEAKEKLDKLLANPRATEEERERARIAYEERVLQLEDLTRTQGQLAEDYDDYAVNGVEGSKQVEDAQRRVQDADRAVLDGRRELAEAQKAQTKALLDGQKAVADAIRDQREQAIESAERIEAAERRLANERRDQVAQQRQAAAVLSSAQDSLASSQRSLASAYAGMGTAGGAALDNVNDAMGKLGPKAQEFARFIHGLRDEFFNLRTAASEGMLSGLQTAITMLLPYLPGLTDFVGKVGDKLGQTFIDFANVLKDPVFVDFFQYIKETAVPTLDTWFKISTNFLKGFVGLFMAFTPFSEDVSDGILGMSESFAEWATTLDTNKGFQEFLAYIRENGPAVMDFFGGLIEMGWNLIKAMAPLGPVVLTVLDGIIGFINAIPPDVLLAIVAGIAGLAAAISIMGIVTSALAISATAWIVGVVIAVNAIGVALWGLLFSRVKPLREFFISLWQAISDGAILMWSYLQPVLMDTWNVIVDLWQGAFVPAFQGIWEIIKFVWSLVQPILKNVGLVLLAVGAALLFLYKNIWLPYFKLIVWVITSIVVPIIKWLWKNIIKPTFDYISIAVEVLATVFEVAFGSVQIAAKILGAVFVGFYRLFIKPWVDAMEPVFDWFEGVMRDDILPVWKVAMAALGALWETLKQTAKTPIKFIVETLLNNGILAGYNKLADMFDVTPKNVKITTPKGWATGGVMDVLPGYSPGVDDHTFYSPTGGVIGLSGGEGILRPEVTALVRPWLDQANLAARQGGRSGVQRFLGGYKNGGVVGKPQGDGLGDWWNASKKKTASLWNNLTDSAGDVFAGIKDFATDPGGYLKKIADKMIDLVPGKDTIFVKSMLGLPRKFLDTMTEKVKSFIGIDGGGSSGGELGGAIGGRGWRWQMATLREKFPGLDLYSGYRHSYTSNGSLSWHGRDGGRAVDIPPRHDVFNFIHDTFGRATQELIWLGDKFRNIHHGKHHVYDNALLQNHGTAGMPNAHIHWAYDQGGWLPDTRNMPGQMMSVFHGRRQPDAVLSNNQWDSISRVARQGMSAGGSGRGDTYNFDFERSVLTADRLSSIQSRRDTLDRVSRPNR